MVNHDGLLEFGDGGRRKKLIIGGSVAAVVLVIVIIGLAVGLSTYVPFTLPQTAPGQFHYLQRTDLTRVNGDHPIMARSYDGNPWETVPDLDFEELEIDCTEKCIVMTRGKYEVKEFVVPSYLKENVESDRLWSRLLSQATFGTSKTDLKNVVSSYPNNNFLAWIHDQMKLNPTLHRTYYRQRTNPRKVVEDRVGTLYEPCEFGSRWHRFVFDILDETKTLVVSNSEVPNVFTLRVGGVLRGEVTTFLNYTWPNTPQDVNTTNMTFPATFTICKVAESVNGTVKLASALNTSACIFDLRNPIIQFTNPVLSVTKIFGANDAQFTPVSAKNDIIVLTQITSSCSLGTKDAFIGYNDGYYRYDPRLKLLENSLENPVNVDAQNDICPVVVRNFINAPQCVRRATCAPLTFSAAPVKLDDSTLRAWFTESNRAVYYFTGLRLEAPYEISPCTGMSRWRRLGPGPCNRTATLSDETLTTLTNALANSTDTNPYVRDITLNGKNCTANAATIGVQIQAGDECFEHVHPDLYSVRDATYWTLYHDGNVNALAANRPNPIRKYAEQGSANLEFPDWHPMGRWYDKNRYIPSVGRYGDTIDFRVLPTELQTIPMATRVNAILSRSNEGYEVCGSPGEAFNDPTLGNRYQLPDPTPSDLKTRELDWPHPFNSGKSMIWTNVILKAPDQLRQRVAWAIAQILTLSTSGLERSDENEPWVSYYDIFVRNAFGNYRDIMKEVSYHPMMSFYLSYYQNKAYAFAKTYPDENYAREIMQLFSIGLWKLDLDGTMILDKDGNPIPTYTNDDIVDFARLWTGFDLQQPRSNTEQKYGVDSGNVLDPLQIKPGWRDLLPKAKLDKGFLGDKYPLCDSLPPQHWLKEGARYMFTGGSSIEGKIMDAEDPKNVGFRGRFSPSPSSALYQKLCQPDVSGKCTFPTEVVLDSNLPCDGKECDAGRVISVKIFDAVANLTKYYTYISTPCVRLTFYNEGKITSSSTSKQCTNPIYTVGTPVCCNVTATRVFDNNTANCLFANEATNYETAVSRCTNAGLLMCNVNFTSSATWTRTCAEGQYQWINASCKLQIQVYPTGQVGIVDPIVTNTGFKVLRPTSNNVYRARWNNELFPSIKNGCGKYCEVVSTPTGDTCLCNITVKDRVVYTDNTVVPSKEDLLNTLFVGAANPSSFGSGVYIKCTTCSSKHVTVWTKAGSNKWDESTIFELSPLHSGAPKIYLANIESIVHVNQYSFRNPPHFMPLTGEQTNTGLQWSSDALWLPRAQQEVEALLDHLFYHSSTAPFVCYRLIQRMVTSNPSPRYMIEVVNAFRTGYYRGEKFSGKYGDLGAAVAAVLLDREARSIVMEADPTFGLLREPIIKVMHLLRALEYQSRDSMEVILPDIDGKIGMEAYGQPTVFGFFLPENRPSGPITEAGLVSPEAQLGTPPLIVGYMNGIVSLIDSGLTNCNLGFGTSYGRNCRNITTSSATSDGALSYKPEITSTPEEVIKELDLLLTSGKMNPSAREYVTQRYTNALVNATTIEKQASALKLAQKLVISTPEYHSTSANILTNKRRTNSTTTPSKGRPYKAIIVFFMNGGCDSYNMIIPHSGCAKKDLYEEYASVRGLGALDKASVLPLSVPAGTQPCNTFGLHGSMPTIKSLYDQKDALFLANIGALVEPITKADYKKTSGVTKKLPPSLFAHNVMQRSMHSLHPQNAASQGVLGRAVAALQKKGAYKSELFSLIGTVKMLEGIQEPDYIDPYNGITKFSQYNDLKGAIFNFTDVESESMLSETYARLLRSSLEKTEAIAAQFKAITLNTTFGTDYVSRQLSQVAKLIKMRNNTERAVFVTQRGGYDTHGTFDMTNLFGDVDKAIKSFMEEMKFQGMWDNVAIVTVSEFGRTLSTNGGGTDHAWAGHHFLTGGKVRGGKILGTYPDTLTDDGDLNIGRGRILPTHSWEAVWKGLVEWFGVEQDQLSYVLPNIGNFPAKQLFSKNELFEN